MPLTLTVNLTFYVLNLFCQFWFCLFAASIHSCISALHHESSSSIRAWPCVTCYQCSYGTLAVIITLPHTTINKEQGGESVSRELGYMELKFGWLFPVLMWYNFHCPLSHVPWPRMGGWWGCLLSLLSPRLDSQSEESSRQSHSHQEQELRSLLCVVSGQLKFRIWDFY